jgi:hypothetical protein
VGHFLHPSLHRMRNLITESPIANYLT